jgi:hypothetical protein
VRAFIRPAQGDAPGMTDDNTDLDVTDDVPGVRDAAPEGDDPVLDPGDTEGERAGYDVEAVSGDTDIYRPDE